MTAVLAVVAWLSAVYRRPGAWREPGGWALSGTLAALALGLTLKVPAVYEGVEDLTGVPNLAQLMKDAAVVLSAFGTQVVLLHLLRPAAGGSPWARRRVLVTVVTLAAMTGVFLLARPVVGVDALRAHLAAPGLVEFRTIYLVYLVWAFVDIARLCWRFARLAGDRLLAIGLRLIAFGGVVGLGYAASGAVQVFAAGRHDLALVQRTQHASDALIGVATLLVVLGSTLPSIIARTAGRRASRLGGVGSAPPGLQTLWNGVTRALPEFVLPATTRAGLTAQEQLYRQVIEVEDARLALRPLRDLAVEHAALEAVVQHGVEDSQRGAAVEGVALALAVDRLHTGGPALPMPEGLTTDPPAPLDASAVSPAGNLNSEISWLALVGRWYGDETLTATARRLLAASAQGDT